MNSPLAAFNVGGFDVSSIFVDPHDNTGNTFYVTLQGFITAAANGSLVYRSVDGGAHWITIQANLPNDPANSILVDPNDANTVYVALDTGVYVTRNINLCTDSAQNCWSPLGTGLPGAPVTQLQAINYGDVSLLRAATYGRGIWEIPFADGRARGLHRNAFAIFSHISKPGRRHTKLCAECHRDQQAQ